MLMRWRDAMETALYGPTGFFRSQGAGPAGHFRTSAHASPLFAAAVLRLLEKVDAALGRPDRLDLVDVGAGRGELLAAVQAAAPPALARRLDAVAVELAPRPPDLDSAIGWQEAVPAGITGLLLATEWLDNVPLDLAMNGRYLLVDPATGEESPGDLVSAADDTWLARWWPAPGDAPARSTGPSELNAGQGPPDGVTEIGRPRDEAWAAAVGSVRRGAALAVDYGHLRTGRPIDGTLTGYRGGRQVPPVPDGSCDVTAHVAIDAVAAAPGVPYLLLRQRDALRTLGVDGTRPPRALAATDPSGYLRALATASAAAELTDPAGLGGHFWLLQLVGVDAAGTGLGTADVAR